jgi:hypothetical protein
MLYGGFDIELTESKIQIRKTNRKKQPIILPVDEGEFVRDLKKRNRSFGRDALKQ